MKKRKCSLVSILLLPLLLVVLLQGVLPFTALLMSRTKETMIDAEVSIDRNTVENRKIALKNAMVDQWGSVRRESSYLNARLVTYLEANGMSMDSFLGDREAKLAYSESVFQEMMDYLQRDTSSGLFLILSNGNQEGGDYTGFYLRDSDPTAETMTNSDLLLERGSKTLAQTAKISLDNAWTTSFHFLNPGEREADDFFYEPYLLALENKDVDMANLAYWSMPFVLEDSRMDNHRMITYSVPLLCNGRVYGILGTEASISYLMKSYLAVQDLDVNQRAGYVLAAKQADGSYQRITGKGVLYEVLGQDTDSFALAETKHRDLYQVQGVQMGSQKVYAVQTPLGLYENQVPYENTDWVLLGLVTEDSVFGLGNRLYRMILTTILVCAAAGMVLMFLVVNRVMRPVYRLMDSVRGGSEGLKAFRPSRILEVDELHDVAEKLTDSELRIQQQLKEEKERYRIAVECSNDMFFTYREAAGALELVNSRYYDGVWPLHVFWDQVVTRKLSEEDQKKCTLLFNGEEKDLTGEICVRVKNDPAGHWYAYKGTVVADPKNQERQIVGYLRDIHASKMLALAREAREMQDPVTCFIRMAPGQRQIERRRRQQPAGVLLLLDLNRFSYIVKNCGLAFGDVLLQEFAWLLREMTEKQPGGEAVLVRAGSDEFLVWLPGVSPAECRWGLAELKNRYAGLVRNSSLELSFHCGMTASVPGISTQELIRRADVALAEAKKQAACCLEWKDLQHSQVERKPFGEIVSQGYSVRNGLASLALNIFDRSFALEASLDLIALRLQREYGLENLLITSFNENYLNSTVQYEWKPLVGKKGWVSAIPFTEVEFQHRNQLALTHKLQPVRRESGRSTVLGLSLPMTDNGQYAGDIFLLGLPETLLEDHKKNSTLCEICTIIQNCINQKQHDLSARAKSDFLARMSHEIRTPMNGIIGMTEIALQENQSEEKRLDCLRKVESSSHYLLGLLNDILDMSKIESGKMNLNPEPFDLQVLLDNLHAVLDGRFLEKEQNFRMEIEMKHTGYLVDALRLSQVLVNLLGNASKYSAEQTDITLTVRESEGPEGNSLLYFAVKDQGIGIAKEDQQRIFRRFEQVDTVTARQQGTGLGLAISNRLVRLMGSCIELESAPGEGSCFYFTLQLPRTVLEGVTEKQAQQEKDFTGTRILVAEDNALNMEILCTFLEALGCVPEGAENGQRAVERFRQSPEGYYQLILMDVMMPVMDGLEAAHRIRLLQRTDSRSVPIAAVSANAFEEDIRRSLASGMNAHLSKPVDMNKLRELMGELL